MVVCDLMPFISDFAYLTVKSKTKTVMLSSSRRVDGESSPTVNLLSDAQDMDRTQLFKGGGQVVH